MALLSRHPKMTVLCFVLMLIAGVVSMGMLLSQATDPILQIHAGSLTTYLPASATNVQDIRPLVGHRGVNIEGSLRAAPGFALAIQGNPFENEWRGGPGMNGPVNVAMGTFREFEVDLSFPAPGFRWNVGRSYNHRQRTSADAHRDSDGYQGVNWFQTSQPEIVLHEDGQDPDDDVLYLVYGADRFIEFSRVYLAEGTSDTFLAVNGAAGVVVYEEGEPDTYTYFDQHGNEVTFFGFGYYAYHAKGQIWKMTDPAGNVAYVGDETTGSTAISSGYNVNGGIAIAYDTAGRRYTYTYTTLDSVERLTRVKAEEDDGGWVERARVEYTYYSDQDHGDPGDLKLVEVTTPLSDSNVDLTQKKYYRYFEGSYDAQSNPGYPHAIKMVLDFEGTRNFDWDGQTFDEDFLAVEDEYLRAHATIALEYDQDHRARKTIIRGGCCGMSDGTYEYEYESSANYSNNVLGYDTEWCTRTIVKRPDGSYHTQYFDEVAQPLASVITGADPDTNPTARWATDVVRGNVGEIRAVYTPACTTAYNHTTGAITKSSTDGLQWIPNRSTSGDTKNFVVNRKFRKGSSGTQYYDGAWTYGTASITPSSADADVVRPFVATRRVYPDLETTDTSSRSSSRTRTLQRRARARTRRTSRSPRASRVREARST
ncbi:MAG: hypothetical protein HY812_19090 [Planctomycetes bacterium]|nr:hypothetical protein [Planctomycetota bacterium]